MEMSMVVRKDKVMTKKEIVSNATSWVKGWLRLGAPKGPRWREALRRVDFQWGGRVGEWVDDGGVTHLR